MEWQFSIWNMLVIAHRVNVNYAFTAGQLRAGSAHVRNHPANLASEQQLPVEAEGAAGVGETDTGRRPDASTLFKGEASSPTKRIKIPPFVNPRVACTNGGTAGSSFTTRTVRRGSACKSKPGKRGI